MFFCDKVLKKGVPEIGLCRHESLDEKEVKLALIGSGDVGKTAFVRKLASDSIGSSPAIVVALKITATSRTSATPALLLLIYLLSVPL